MIGDNQIYRMYSTPKLDFSIKLATWYALHKRNLPWRNTNNPYIIWLSEIILQQTRVAQGEPYFHKFVSEFPDIQSLAQAEQDKVLLLWQGLGYYSRARNLHSAAKLVANDFEGVFPTLYRDIRSLKGVGDYTAAAIASFAYGLPYATVDGNVYRVLARVFGIDTPMDTTQGKKEFAELAHYLLDKENPGLHNQAMMEFGALQCVPLSPDCTICPFCDSCVALATDTIKRLPAKQGKTKVRSRYLNYIDMRCNGQLLLGKRQAGDIWEGLYEFPLIESRKNLDWSQLSETKEWESILQNAKPTVIRHSFSQKHVLSHQILYANFYSVEVDQLPDGNYQLVDEDSMQEYPVSRLIARYLLRR